MKTNILTAAVALSDRDLLARIDDLVRTEREATAELVGHLAALELRPSLYAASGYGSLFDYCTDALHLSEDAACTRIRAARTCRDFPLILDLLSSGAVSLSAVRLLGPHLTAENHEKVLARATSKRLQDIQALVAELAPRPDVPSSMRKLPGPVAPASVLTERTLTFTETSATSTDSSSQTDGATSAEAATAVAPDLDVVPNHGTVLALQALMRRELPDGDLAVIFDQGVRLLLEKVEKAKLGIGAKRGPGVVKPGAYEARIRFKTDGSGSDRRESADPRSGNPGEREATKIVHQRERPSRHIPNEVKRAVWRRDGGQCTFVSANGRRCTERAFLEFHHIQPYAMDGPTTVANIALRCRRHNQYEAEVIFGPRDAGRVREAPALYGSRRIGVTRAES